jgi:hypothetical protein
MARLNNGGFIGRQANQPNGITASGKWNVAEHGIFKQQSFWPGDLDGSSSAKAAPSAQHLLNMGITQDGVYWLRPPGCPEAFQTHCYMSIESGGWMLVLRFDSTFNGGAGQGSFPAGSFLTSDWSGWSSTTKSQIDALGYTSSNATGGPGVDTNAFTPVFAHSSFNDVMVIANRTGQQSKRLGWRHNSTIASMYSVTGGKNSSTVGDSVLFGEPKDWLYSLDIRSDTNVQARQTTGRYGFKIRSDSANYDISSFFTGGWTVGISHYGAMIGCGRENTEGSRWGGGIGGFYTTGSRRHRCNGHWWDHGDGRSSAAWNAGDSSSAFHGHAVYVR